MKKAISIMSVVLVVFLCSFPVFADTLPTAGAQTGEQKYLNDELTVYVSSRVFKPNLLDYDFMSLVDREYFGTNNQQYPWSGINIFNQSVSYTFEEQVIFNINIRNEGDYLAYSDTDYLSILPNFTFHPSRIPQGFFIENLSEDFTVYNLMANGEIRLKPVNQRYGYSGRVGIPKDTNTTISFIVHFLYYGGSGTYDTTNSTGSDMYPYDENLTMITVNSITVPHPTDFTYSNVTTSGNDIVTFWRFDQWLSIISQKLNRDESSYNSVSNDSAAVESGSNAIASESSTNHQTELSYFNQTNQALSSAGIDTYTFNNEQIGGIGSVSNDFTSVWNSLGSWTSVYIFSLTLSLGLAIIRHVRPIQRSKEE